MEQKINCKNWRKFGFFFGCNEENLKLPSGWVPQTGTHVSSRRVRFDVLVYTIKDGKMAIGLPQLDEAEGTVASYYGPALMAIEKDGKWELVDSGRSG
jgi:hypothetical protein